MHCAVESGENPTVLAYHPHGVFCCGFITNAGFREEIQPPVTLTKANPLVGLVADALYHAVRQRAVPCSLFRLHHNNHLMCPLCFMCRIAVFQIYFRSINWRGAKRSA